MKRGEVRYYEFAPPDKRRPVLLLSRDAAIRQLNEVVVAPITSTIRNLPTEVRLDDADGMPKPCVINLDHVQTIPKYRIGDRLTKLGAAQARCGRTRVAVRTGFSGRDMTRPTEGARLAAPYLGRLPNGYSSCLRYDFGTGSSTPTVSGSCGGQ